MNFLAVDEVYKFLDEQGVKPEYYDAEGLTKPQSWKISTPSSSTIFPIPRQNTS